MTLSAQRPQPTESTCRNTLLDVIAEHVGRPDLMRWLELDLGLLPLMPPPAKLSGRQRHQGTPGAHVASRDAAVLVADEAEDRDQLPDRVSRLLDRRVTSSPSL